MEKELYDKIMSRILFLNLELSSGVPVVGKVVYINAPLSNSDYLFCQIQEVFLKCEGGSLLQNLNFPISLWVNIKQILIPLVGVAEENIIPRVIYSHEDKLSSVKNDNIFTVSYKKEHFDHNLFLALYNLKRFSYDWKVSSNEDEVLFTLVKNMKRR